MDDERRVDPSSISLFAPTVSDAVVEAAGSENRPSFSTSKQVQTAPATERGDDDEGEGKFSAYKQKKNVELIRRRNLIDRLGKLKDRCEVSFTIPQMKTATNNQLSILLRRLRKSSEIENYLSDELLERIFVTDEFVEAAKIPSKMQNRREIERMREKLSSGRFFCAETQRMSEASRTPKCEEVITDEEITDYEDDDIYGAVDNFTLEQYELLEQEMQLLAADARAAQIQNELKRVRGIVERELIKLEESHGQCIFEQPLNAEEESMTSARCRPLLQRSQPTFNSHNFDELRREQNSFRPVISHKRCGTSEYCFADGSIHPHLSLPTSIPLDVQILKYLHVVDFVPAEIELRRFKTAKMMSQHVGSHQKKLANFYNLEEEFREDEDKISSFNSKGIKISFRKPMKKQGDGDSTTESDPNDSDYGRGSIKFKQRRMTYSIDRSGTSKPTKLEARRTSHADFGPPVFDYDPHVMDIGLPLPTIQKVENVEIAIPSFRKKSGLLKNSVGADDSNRNCERCRTSAGAWEEITRLHADLELQEKSLRFRPPLGSSSRKSTMTSTNNPMQN